MALESIPLAGDRPAGSRVALGRPRRSRFMRLLADTDLDWRAQACTALLIRGWTEIHAETTEQAERVSALRP